MRKTAAERDRRNPTLQGIDSAAGPVATPPGPGPKPAYQRWLVTTAITTACISACRSAIVLGVSPIITAIV